MTVAVLATSLRLERTSLTRSLARLEALGAVPPGDKRKRLITLTAGGELLLARAFPYWDDAQSRLMDAVGKKAWNRALQAAGRLSDVTPHVHRHSFASIANDLGFTEVTIAALVGHAKDSVTKNTSIRLTQRSSWLRTRYLATSKGSLTAGRWQPSRSPRPPSNAAVAPASVSDAAAATEASLG